MSDSSTNPILSTNDDEVLDLRLPAESYKRGTFGPMVLILAAAIADVEAAKTPEEAVRQAVMAAQESDKRLGKRRRDEIEKDDPGYKFCGYRFFIVKRAAGLARDWIWEDSTHGQQSEAYGILVRALDHLRHEIDEAGKHLPAYKRPGDDDDIAIPVIRRRAKPAQPTVDYDDLVGAK